MELTNKESEYLLSIYKISSENWVRSRTVTAFKNIYSLLCNYITFERNDWGRVVSDVVDEMASYLDQLVIHNQVPGALGGDDGYRTYQEGYLDLIDKMLTKAIEKLKDLVDDNKRLLTISQTSNVDNSSIARAEDLIARYKEVKDHSGEFINYVQTSLNRYADSISA